MSANSSLLNSSSAIVESQKPDVPVLPDDILMTIFEYLSTEERVPLGKTCKRWRHLDFEVGKKTYENIEILWNCVKICIYANEKGKEYVNTLVDFKSIQDSMFDFHRLFRQARTDSLKIWCLNLNSCRREFEFLSTMLKTVTYKKLNVFFNTMEFSESFLASLMKGQKINDVQVRLSLQNTNPDDIIRARDMIKKLPKLDKLTLNWGTECTFDTVLPGECLINDEALLHIITHTNHAQLELGDCSAQAIFRTFEIVSHSPLNTKFVSFYAPKNEIDSLFSSINSKYEIINDQIIDWETRTALTIHPSLAYYYVRFVKFDADGQIIV